MIQGFLFRVKTNIYDGDDTEEAIFNYVSFKKKQVKRITRKYLKRMKLSTTEDEFQTHLHTFHKVLKRYTRFHWRRWKLLSLTTYEEVKKWTETFFTNYYVEPIGYFDNDPCVYDYVKEKIGLNEHNSAFITIEQLDEVRHIVYEHFNHSRGQERKIHLNNIREIKKAITHLTDRDRYIIVFKDMDFENRLMSKEFSVS